MGIEYVREAFGVKHDGYIFILEKVADSSLRDPFTGAMQTSWSVNFFGKTTEEIIEKARSFIYMTGQGLSDDEFDTSYIPIKLKGRWLTREQFVKFYERRAKKAVTVRELSEVLSGLALVSGEDEYPNLEELTERIFNILSKDFSLMVKFIERGDSKKLIEYVRKKIGSTLDAYKDTVHGRTIEARINKAKRLKAPKKPDSGKRWVVRLSDYQEYVYQIGRRYLRISRYPETAHLYKSYRSAKEAVRRVKERFGKHYPEPKVEQIAINQ